MSACWQEVVKLPRFLEAAGVGATPRHFGPSWFVKQGSKTFRYGLGAGSIDNGDGTFTCSDGSVVQDPSACPAPIAAGVTDNGDGTFTCQDGSVVSDPSTCPQPSGGGGGGGGGGGPVHETGAKLNADGSTTIFWSDGTTTIVPPSGGGGSVVSGGQGGGGGGGGTITPVLPPATTTATPTNYAPYILGAAALTGAGIIGYAIYRRRKRGARR